MIWYVLEKYTVVYCITIANEMPITDLRLGLLFTFVETVAIGQFDKILWSCRHPCMGILFHLRCKIQSDLY